MSLILAVIAFNISLGITRAEFTLGIIIPQHWAKAGLCVLLNAPWIKQSSNVAGGEQALSSALC